MRKSLLADAFGHHVWATLRLIDACDALAPEQLGTAVWDHGLTTGRVVEVAPTS